MRILIADDSALSRMILERIVSNLIVDGEILLAGDGKEARDIALGESAPGVLLLDWMMPKMDGTEVCRAIRKSALPTQPYIFLASARDGKQDIAEGLDAGANDYLVKPYDETELNARLRVAIRMYTLQQALTSRTEALESARREISILQELLPVCARCRSVSASETGWGDIRAYLENRTDVSLGKFVCLECKGTQRQER